MQAAVAAVEDAEGAVGALVNNAGYSQSGAVESVNLDDIRAQFETNVFGLIRMSQLVLPKMRERGEGRVVNVGSMGGKLTFPGGGIYHATKYAVEAISDAMRFELAGFGVQVVLIEPGLIVTEFASAAVGCAEHRDGPERALRRVQPGRGGLHGGRVQRARRQAGRWARDGREGDREGDHAAPPEGPLPGDALRADRDGPAHALHRPDVGRVRGTQFPRPK